MKGMNCNTMSSQYYDIENVYLMFVPSYSIMSTYSHISPSRIMNAVISLFFAPVLRDSNPNANPLLSQFYTPTIEPYPNNLSFTISVLLLYHVWCNPIQIL